MRNPKPRQVSIWWRLELAAVALVMIAGTAAGIASIF